MKKIYCDACGDFTEKPTKLMKLDFCESCAVTVQEKIVAAIEEIKGNSGQHED